MSNFDLLLKQLQYVADLLPTLSSQEQEEAVTVIRDFSSQVTQLYTDPAHDIAESSLNPAMSGSTYGVDDNTMDHDDTVAAETDVDELNANEQVESLLELKETHFDAVDTSTPIADELGHVQENPTESAHELGHVVEVPTESGVDPNNEMTSFVILNGHEQETLTAPTEVFTETALACETISENVILSMPQDGLDENQSVKLNQQHFQDVIPKCESKEPNNILPETLCHYNMTDFSSMELANNDGMGPAEQIAQQSSPESTESSDVSCQKLVDDVPVTTVVDEVKKPMKTVRFMIDTPNAEPLPGRAQQKVVLLVLDEATQNQNFMSYSPGDSFTKQTTFGTPRACKICNKVMSNASNLKVHMRSHTSERPYQCSECTAGFTTRANLTRHEASHRGQRPHQCTVCGRGFLEKKTLVHHMRTHTGEKPYHCQHCQKTFRQLSSLRTHSLIHLGQKKHRCELCDKTFRTKAALTSHRSKHGKDKRFQCDICQEVFSKKSEALQHRNLHFSNPYKCERCSATFMYHSSYTTHYTSVHGRLESSSTDDSEDNAPPGLYLSTAGQPGASTGQRRENSFPITRLFPDTTKRKSVSISDQRTSSSLADIADSVDESTPKLNFCGLRACRQKKGSEAMVQLRSGQMVLVKKSDIVPKPVNYQC